MPLDFPNSPDLNDQYTSGGRTWTWDGTAWISTDLGPVPDQAGNDGKFLTTNGSALSWAAVPEPDYSSDQSIIAGQVFG
jgi:hypothetical protein